MKAWTMYRSLDAEQKSILKQKQLTLQRPVGELLTLLKPLAQCDSVANTAQGRFGCTFALLMAATLGSPFLLGNIGWSPVTLAAQVLIIVVTITCFVVWRWLAGIDVSDNLRKFVLPVLTLFRDDFDPRTPVNLRLDLSSPTHKSKKTGEGQPFAQGVYYKIVDTTYVDPWMSASALLVDGTKLSWSVTDRIRERRKTKRNARRKIKTKTKYRKISDLDVRLALKAKSFAVADATLSADGKRNKVAVERSVRLDSLDPIDPRVLIDAITEVYRAAQPATKEATA